MTEKEQTEISEQNTEYAYGSGKIVFRVPGQFVDRETKSIVKYGYALVVKPGGAKAYNVDEDVLAALIHLYENVPELREFLSNLKKPIPIKPRALFQN